MRMRMRGTLKSILHVASTTSSYLVLLVYSILPVTIYSTAVLPVPIPVPRTGTSTGAIYNSTNGTTGVNYAAVYIAYRFQVAMAIELDSSVFMYFRVMQ